MVQVMTNEADQHEWVQVHGWETRCDADVCGGQGKTQSCLMQCLSKRGSIVNMLS